MYIPFALMCMSFWTVHAHTSPATKGTLIQVHTNGIETLAQTTLVHIKNLRSKLQRAPNLTVSTPPITGLASVARNLQLLEQELQSPSTDLLSQIQADVSSLDGRVQSLGSVLNCSLHPRPTASRRAKLLFPDIHNYRTIAKVERYLQDLCAKKEKLQIC